MLTKRSQQSEILDTTPISFQQLSQTMRGLARLNRFLGNQAVIKNSFIDLLAPGDTKLTVIDLGCGGGDSLRLIADILRARNIEADLIGIDINPLMLEFAAKQSETYPEIRFQRHDVLSQNFAMEECDLLISTQFLYRFPDNELTSFLQQATQKVRRGMIFSDLQRHGLAYLGFWALATALRFDHLLKADGLTAIKRAYRRGELETIYRNASLDNAQLIWKWAFRYLTVIELESSKPISATEQS